MLRLDGNNILIADSMPGVADEFCQVVSEFGANCHPAASLVKAKEALVEQDFDLVICNHHLQDGDFRNLYRWSQEFLIIMPKFSILCDGQEQIEDISEYHLAGVLDKSNPGALLHKITNFLFNFDDFVNCLINMSDVSTIHYELRFENAECLFLPIELTDAGIFFSAEEDLVPSSTCFLHIYFFDGVVAKSFTLAGVAENPAKGHFFRVHSHYRLTWKSVMKKLDQKQTHIASFLKKAAGL